MPRRAGQRAFRERGKALAKRKTRPVTFKDQKRGISPLATPFFSSLLDTASGIEKPCRTTWKAVLLQAYWETGRAGPKRFSGKHDRLGGGAAGYRALLNSGQARNSGYFIIDDLEATPRLKQALKNWWHDHSGHALGRNPGDFWRISTKPFPGTHFAVYPEDLCERPILSSCPALLCTEWKRYYLQALGPWESKDQEVRTVLASTLNNLAALYGESGRYAQASRLRGRLWTLVRAELGDAERAEALDNLAYIALHGRDYGEAAALFQKALAIQERAVGSEHPEEGRLLSGLAMTLAARGQNLEAVALLERSARILEQTLGPEHPNLVVVLANLAETLGPTAKAESVARRALEIAERAMGAEHFLTGQLMFQYASILRQRNRKGEARPWERRAREVMQKYSRENQVLQTVDISDLRGVRR